jgi:hypothetical protein
MRLLRLVTPVPSPATIIIGRCDSVAKLRLNIALGEALGLLEITRSAEGARGPNLRGHV